MLPSLLSTKQLLTTKGINLAGDGAAIGKAGRKLSYTLEVQGNGNLLVGKAYVAMLNLEPGDEFEIKLGKKAIRLTPVGTAAERASGAEGVSDEGDTEPTTIEG